MENNIFAQTKKAETGVRRLSPVIIVYLALALSASAALSFAARKIPYFDLDLIITRRLQAFRPKWFDRLMGLVCDLGYPAQANAFGIVVIGLLYRLGLQWEAVTTVFATLGSALTALALLLYVNRPRPSEELVRVNNHLPTTSFPSGHTLIFTAVVGFLSYLALKSQLPRLVRAPVILLMGAVVVLMGPARVYSGEHWTSDVIAGYLVGSAWLAAAIRFYHWGKPRYFRNHSRKQTWPD